MAELGGKKEATIKLRKWNVKKKVREKLNVREFKDMRHVNIKHKKVKILLP